MPIKKRIDGDTLKAFRNHGFRQNPKMGNDSQAIGNCVFCGKADHFYINRETKQWDCKRCGKAGGFQIFLNMIVEHNKNIPGIEEYLNQLSDNRGLSVETFEAFDVGYNPETNEYSFPIYISEGGENRVYNVRRYSLATAERPAELRGTAGCLNGILNWDMTNEYEKIWLCEGEWDAMAMAEMLYQLGLNGTEMAVGMPGASIFKPEWLSLFQDKEVIVVYDNDDAGRAGAMKAYNMLTRSTPRLKFLHWGEEKDGFDIRDLFIREGKEAYSYIVNRLQQYPQGTDVSFITPVTSRFDGKGLSVETIYDHYLRWLNLPNTDVIDIVFGTIVANRQHSDSVWMFLVAPPGGAKTELLEALISAPNIVYKNQLGAKSLVSGSINAGGQDPSLLPKLHERMLVIEDFTTVLSIPAGYREEIFGILRAAYNGRYERDYGNGRIFRCECRFGILAGVTQAIEQYSESFSALGERFLSYYIPIPKDLKGRRPYLKRAQQNRGSKKEMKDDLSRIAKEALDYDFKQTPILDTHYEDKILDLAQLTSMIRGTVHREKYSSAKEVINEPYSELGTRLVIQYSNLVDGIARFKRIPRITEKEYNVVRHIAYGSCPSERRSFLRAMSTDLSRGWSTADIADITGLPRYPLLDRVAETLYLLGILKKSKSIEGVRSTYSWYMDPDFAELTESTSIFNH